MTKEEKVPISAEVFKSDKEWLEQNIEGFNQSLFIRKYFREFVEGKKTEAKEKEEIKQKVEQLQFSVQSMENELSSVMPELMELQKKRTNLKIQQLKKPPGVD